MANFDTAYKHTMAAEGAYANNPNDRGGETWKGIARKWHPNWGGWQIIDYQKSILVNARAETLNPVLNNSEALEKLVRAFYKAEFWGKLCLELVLSQAIANELFDTAVNCGTSVAATFLQRVLNVCNLGGKLYPDVAVDGNIGGATIAALNKAPKPENILTLLNCLQGTRYVEIAEKNPSQEVFVNSWTSRVLL